MAAPFFQHVALRVADIERSRRFYIDVFGARSLTRPIAVGGPTAEEIHNGPPGVEHKVCILALGAGHIELFEFLSPRQPMESVHASQVGLMHFAIQVDDFDEYLARAEAAGARRVWDVPRERGGGRLIYLADLDGHVLEISDVSMEDIAASVIAEVPAAAPDGEGAP